MAEAKKERYRRIRGAILKLLAQEHPGSVDLKVLHFLLDHLNLTITEEECAGHVDYLEKKGFLKTEKRRSGKIELAMAVITPEGLDLLDGCNSDVGVNVDF